MEVSGSGRNGSRRRPLQIARSIGILLLLCSVAATWTSVLAVGAASQSESNEVMQMPQLFHFKDKLKCLTEDRANIYCVTKTVIKPDESSALWRLIEKNSREHTDYRRYILDRGFCLDDCNAIVKDLTEDQLRFYDHERVPVAEFYIFGSDYIYGMGEYKRKYGKMINICLNKQLQEKYNLSGYSEIEHCMTGADLDKPLNVLHVLFAILSGLILILVLRATFRKTKDSNNNNNNNNNTPIDPCEHQKSDIWMEFSLARSFRRLTVEPNTKIQRDFAFVESVRVAMVLVITLVHVLMALGASPIANPEAFAGLFGNPVMRMTAAIFPMLVHTFFTISGMLLAVHFLEYVASGAKFRWSLLVSGTLSRYLRIFPSYFILWLYQISWSDRLGNGPFDYRVSGIERQMCKITGWTNFLFINNYHSWDKSCMQQCWYLAADFQFYLVGSFFMMLLWRFPRYANKLLIVITAMSIVVPIAQVYEHNFSGVIQANVRHLQTYFMYYKNVRYDYILSHTNLSAYFSGIIAGIAYHRAQQDPKYLKDLRIYQLFKWFAPLMVLTMAAPATLFYDPAPREPCLIEAVYAALFRNFYGITCAVGLLYGASDGAWRLPVWTKHPIVLAIGRLSFCVYLVQFNAVRAFVLAADGDGLVLSVINYLYASIMILASSYFFGLLLCVTVELPIAAVIRKLQGTTKHQKKQEEKDSSKIKAS